MTTPATRTPVRIARGTYSDLNASVADILDGEICWATDQDKIYVKDGGALVATMLTSADVGVTVQGYDADTAKLDVTQTFTAAQTFSSGASDSAGSYRIIPQNSKTSSYTLVAADTGKHISITTGGVTVPASVFSVGDVISIYNNSGSNQTITQGSSTTLRQAGTANTGNRTLAQYGVATVLCVASNTFVISGAGLS